MRHGPNRHASKHYYGYGERLIKDCQHKSHDMFRYRLYKPTLNSRPKENRSPAQVLNILLVTTGFASLSAELAVTHVLACDRFALGAAGKLASIALEELSKPGKVEGGSPNRTADNMSALQPPRCTLSHLLHLGLLPLLSLLLSC